jgi:RNA polymerase sigma-70 factor (ECF subfamily)
MELSKTRKELAEEKIDINELNSLVKNGDKQVFINLIEKYKLDMYRMGKAILEKDEDIGDAMQETVLKAYQNIRTLKKLDSFKPWLLKIMVNECNNILRRKKKVIFFDNFFNEETYEDNYSNLDNQPVLRAVKSLEDNFKKVILLHYYEDLSVKDISKTLDISEGTVKSRLSRARKKLFEFLKGVEI